MSLVGAFARTSAVRAGVLRPVAADKVKWWSKVKPNDGEVSASCDTSVVVSAGFLDLLLTSLPRE